MSDIVNGKNIDTQLLENLNSNIKELRTIIAENNRITSNQNDLLLRYNERLVWLTGVIVVIAIAQFLTIFIK